MSKGKFRACVGTLVEHGFVEFDTERNLVFLIDAFLVQLPTSETVVTGVARRVVQWRTSPIFENFRQRLAEVLKGTPEGLAHRLPGRIAEEIEIAEGRLSVRSPGAQRPEIEWSRGRSADGEIIDQRTSEHRTSILEAPSNEERREKRHTHAPPDGMRSEELDLEFADFWAEYPRPENQHRARRAYAHARQHASAEELLAGLRLAIEHAGWFSFANDGTQFQPPHAHRWLADHRWKDDYGVACPIASVNTIQEES